MARKSEIKCCTDLYNEVADDSSIVRMHAGSERVEDTRHTHFHIGLAVIGVPAGSQGSSRWAGQGRRRRAGGERRGDKRRREERRRAGED